MEQDKIEQFKIHYEKFRTEDIYQQRVEQSTLVPLFREIITETLKNEPLTNEHLTGLIQMFKNRCLEDSFNKYLEINVKSKSKRDEFFERFIETEYTGYTGVGKGSVGNLKSKQLSDIKKFLENAFDVSSVEEAIDLCKEFDRKNIPFVKPGIYSPWLHYINPRLFPINNNSHIAFREWIGMPSDYPSAIRDFNYLTKLVGEEDLGRIDWMTHLFTTHPDHKLKTLNISGHKLFKISHGVFVNVAKFKKAGILKILEENNWIAMGDLTGKNQFDEFKNENRLGDFVYVCYGGNKVHVIGRIKSDIKSLDVALKGKLESKETWSYREIEPLYYASNESVKELKDERRLYMPSGNSTFREVPQDQINFMNENLFIPNFGVKVVSDEDEGGTPDDNKEAANKSKNMILYGPPGTGKTYHSIFHAVAIIENKKFDSVESEGLTAIKPRYDKYVSEGRILFTTFHQSLSYEDFIEGIKPIPPENEGDPINYQVEDGLFKKLCTEAAFSIADSLNTEAKEMLTGFDNYYDHLIEDINEAILKGKQYPLKTKTGGQVFVESVTDYGNILVKHKSGTRPYTVSKRRLAKLDMKIADLKTVSNINNTFGSIIGGSNSSAYWAVLNAIKNIEPSSVEGDLKVYDYSAKKQLIDSLSPVEFAKGEHKPFVIIIDEINRGNIAQIFGELITLLEEDKRLGNETALTVTLPYSKEQFGVPPNLFLIGTMNTADRSVEALDTALRRRFSFILKKPEAEKLKVTQDGIDLKAMITALNTRLKILKDADHTIGHAWLWNVNDVDSLKEVFGNKILPLLQEYFYNDYEKLGLVLGDAFFKEPTSLGEKIFASFKGGNSLSGQYEQVPLFELKDWTELNIEDFKSLYPQV